MASLKYTKGMPNSYLKTTVKKVDGSSALISQASKSAGAAKKDPASALAAQKDLLLAIHQMVEDSKTQSLDLNSRTCDVILDKISQWLEQVNENLTSDEDIEKVKEAIIDEINSASFSKILSAVLVSQVTSLFDDSAKREDIEELKGYIAGLVKESGEFEGGEGGGEQSGTTYSSKEVNSTADEEAGDYRDSTVAANFSTLQQFVENQVNMLNENIESIPGGIGFGKIGKLLGAGFAGVLSATKKLGSKIGSLAKGTFSKLASVTKIIGGGILKGIGSIGSAVKGFGAKVGGAIAHPFKAIGGFFKNRKKDKAEAKKEKLREKFMDFMMKMFEKLWDFLEPILSKLKIFMLIALPPILSMLAIIIGISTLVGLLVFALYKVYSWIKSGQLLKKLAQFGKWLWDKLLDFGAWIWDNLPGWLESAWEWLKDFGSWIWDKLLDFGAWIWDNLPGWLESAWEWLKDFGSWIWEKLKELGDWLWNDSALGKWIHEKIIDPWKKTMDEIESAGGLWAWFKKKLSDWWDQVCQIGKAIKDAVVKWWEETDIYKTYKEIQEKGFGGWFKEKLQNFIDNMLNIGKKLKDWWDNTTVGKWLAGLQIKMQNLMKKIGETIWDLGVCYIRPFGFLVGKPMSLNDQEKKDYKEFGSKLKALDDAREDAVDEQDDAKKEIEKLKHYLDTKDYKGGDGTASFGRTKEEMERDLAEAMKRLENAKKKEESIDKQKAQIQAEREKSMNPALNGPSIPEQQVKNAMQPVNNINNMNAQNNAELQKTGAEMSSKAEAVQKAAENWRQQQALFGSQSLSRFDDLEKKLDKYGNDPAVVPMPIPYGPQRNAAMMEHY